MRSTMRVSAVLAAMAAVLFVGVSLALPPAQGTITEVEFLPPMGAGDVYTPVWVAGVGAIAPDKKWKGEDFNVKCPNIVNCADCAIKCTRDNGGTPQVTVANVTLNGGTWVGVFPGGLINDTLHPTGVSTITVEWKNACGDVIESKSCVSAFGS